MKKIIRLGLAFLIISFMVVSFQKFDCAAAVKTINVSKTEASVPTFLAVPHLQKKAPTSQLFSFLKYSPDVIASGTSGTCDWEITADGILTIDKGQLATGTVPISVNDTNCGSNWTANGNKDKIKEVDIKPGVSLPKDATAVFANLPNVTEIEGLENLDTSETTNISYLFYRCNNLTSLDLSSFNTSQVTDMKYMFYLCYSLTSLNVSNFNTSQVADMKYMFSSCNKLTSLDVSKFDTSQVTDMSGMFYLCSSLTSLNVSNFNTGKVQNMGYMFNYCQKLTSLDVSKFDTSQVTDMKYMFNLCSSLTSLNVSNFNTSQVTDMRYMFSNCSNLKTLDLSNLDTSKLDPERNSFCMYRIFYYLHVWKLTLGNKFEAKGLDSWPRPGKPVALKDSFPYIFYDGKLRYITINRFNGDNRYFEWREVGTGNDPHNPQGTIYKPYDDSSSTNNFVMNSIMNATKKAVSNKTPITFVWNHKPYNASPLLKFTDSSYKEPIKVVTSGTAGKPYAYPYDSRFYKSESYPAFNIYGTLQDEDSSQVTLSYWIDDNSTNKKEVKQPVDTTSSNGEKNDTKVNWSFAITDQDDLTALATYKEGGHTIHVEARDNGIDGQSQDWFIPASATFEAPVAENAIVKFKYQDSSGKPLRDPQTLVRGATEIFNNYSDGYRYDVKQYIPRYLWGKDKDNLLRYGIDNYNQFLSELTWGNVDSVKFENGNLKPTGVNGLKITLTYGKANTISLEVPENLNFGSNILQNMPSKLGLNYPVGKPPKLAVKDTTTDLSWTLYLSITKFINTKDPSKTLDGIFYYNNKPVDSGSEATIAIGNKDFRYNTDNIYSISNSWYSNYDGKQQMDKGPWLNLQGQRPAEGTYQATATWTLKNTPQ